MPHKHTRRKNGDDTSFNLAPSTIAKPLPAHSQVVNPKKPSLQQESRRAKQSGVSDDYKHNDTPRAFVRMMHLQTSKKRPRSGLDDGMRPRPSKKIRMAGTNPSEPGDNVRNDVPPEKELPKILPGERLGEFAARVDQTMPVGGLARKGKVKVEGVKERQTRTERRLHKMYAAWREEDARRKEKLEEQKEEAEEAEAEVDGMREQVAVGKKSKRRKGLDDDDPWRALNANRDERKGLHDVAQAPPSFRAVPREKFKLKNGAGVDVENIPTSAGGLRRREELGEARREVIERYRALMGRKA